MASPLSLNALREDLDVSHRALTHWVDVLERLYFVVRVPPYLRDRSGREVDVLLTVGRTLWVAVDAKVSETRIDASLLETTGVAAAYIFGSRAEGRAHRESDLDVAVLLDRHRYPEGAERFDERLRLIGAIGSAAGLPQVDLVVLNDALPGLARAIVTRGRRVYCRDAEADHAFVRTTLSRAADLDPFLRRARLVKLEAIRR